MYLPMKQLHMIILFHLDLKIGIYCVPLYLKWQKGKRPGLMTL